MHLKRVLSGVVFIPLFFLLVQYGSSRVFFFVLSCFTLVGLYEFFRLLEAKGLRPLKLIGYFGGWALSYMIYYDSSHRNDLLLFLTFLLIGSLSSLLCRTDELKVRLEGAVATLCGILYLPLLLSYLSLLRGMPEGAIYIFYLFVVTWAGDAGAFYFGIRFGRRKLCPSLSPGKSVEGSIAGLLASLGASYLAKWLFFAGLSSFHASLLGVFLGIMGQLGDLSESLLKRVLEVKDSGALIPGHGGFLDRADSILFTGPSLYFYVIHCLLPY